MRIRFEHTRFPHWGGRSGYVQLVQHVAHLVDRSIIHGASDSHADLPRLLWPLRGRLLRRVRREGMPWYKLSDLVAETIAFWACLTGAAEIVHFLDGEHAPLFLPRLLRRAGLRRPRVVATFHQPAGLLGDLVSARVLRDLDAVILMSPSQRGFFERHLPPDRIHVVLHGVDCGFFTSSEGPRRPGTLRCVTVGHWLRDWRVFRDTAASLPDVAFAVVSGRAAGVEDLPNVTVLSGLDDDALAALYRDSDALFMPLLDATANNALLEGIASGLPVVATDLVSVRAYLPGEEALLCRQSDAKAHALAIARLRDDPRLRAQMALAARLRAESLAWPVVAQRHRAIYQAVAATPQGRM